MKLYVRNDIKREGAKKLRDFMMRKILSKCLIQWLKSIYEEEILMQESLDNRRMYKLHRAVLIVEKHKRKDEVMLMRAFKEWKRLELQIVLDSLKQYSAALEKNSTRMFPSKRRFYND